ncbi:Sodium transport ATPase 2 [Venturia nashicola]|nr:Sodium transport ATPase 2 [Venturia nashicola]
MFIRRVALSVARSTPARTPIVARTFASSVVRRDAPAKPETPSEATGMTGLKSFNEIKTEADLFGPGAAPGTVPTDLEQATGLERLEILGKMQGIDVFDMKPLESRKGTMEDPILVPSFGEEIQIGCCGAPVPDSHPQKWLVVSRDRPIGRCGECGNVVKMEYVGPEDDGHGHGHDDHHAHADQGYVHPYDGEPKTFADYIKPEYRYGTP